MATVRMIPPREMKPDTLRVAAYCRVSSDSSDQLHSYASQIRAYTDKISKHDGWELVDIYADEAVTGTRTDKREDFHRLLADCRKGKIDKVLVKSISRFARNTKDCLAALRELTALGVTVCFEKENINTETLTSELMVSVSASLAQEESISISQNQRISYQRRMERGEFITNCAPYGYQIVERKNLATVEVEADIVRWIYICYLEGKSTAQIAQELTRQEIPSPCGDSNWYPQAVQRIIANEKYIGDTLCQKTFTTSTLPFIHKNNHGEKDQYYVENTHPAIVAKGAFEKAQALRQRRTNYVQQRHLEYPLRSKIICDSCNSGFTRKASRKGYITWVCWRHNHRAEDCPIGRIAESEIYAAFVRMYNKLKHYKGIILKPALAQLDDLNTALQRGNPAMLAVNKAIAETSEQSYKIAQLQSRGLLDADACATKLRDINARLTELRRERRRLLKNEDLEEVIDTLRQTADAVHAGPEKLDTFDETLFADLVEKIIAESQTCIRFRLYGGIELTEHLQEARR